MQSNGCDMYEAFFSRITFQNLLINSHSQKIYFIKRLKKNFLCRTRSLIMDQKVIQIFIVCDNHGDFTFERNFDIITLLKRLPISLTPVP